MHIYALVDETVSLKEKKRKKERERDGSAYFQGRKNYYIIKLAASSEITFLVERARRLINRSQSGNVAYYSGRELHIFHENRVPLASRWIRSYIRVSRAADLRAVLGVRTRACVCVCVFVPIYKPNERLFLT